MKNYDLVIVKEENLPPFKQKMGKVVQVYPGNNENVHVVFLGNLQTKNTIAVAS